MNNERCGYNESWDITCILFHFIWFSFLGQPRKTLKIRCRRKCMEHSDHRRTHTHTCTATDNELLLIWIYSSKKLTNSFTFWTNSQVNRVEQELWWHSISGRVQTYAGVVEMDSDNSWFGSAARTQKPPHSKKLTSDSRHVAQSYHRPVIRTYRKIKALSTFTDQFSIIFRLIVD